MGLIDNHSIESVTKGRKTNLKYPSYFYHAHEFSYITQRKGLYNQDEKIYRKRLLENNGAEREYNINK